MKLNLAGLSVVFVGAGILLSFGDDLPTPTTNNVPQEEWVSEVIKLKHERAAEVAAALNGLTTQYRGLGSNSLATKRDAANVLSNAWANVSPQFKETNTQRGMRRESHTPDQAVNLSQEPVTVDERANSLLLYATKSDSQIMKETIAKLDAAREGILIEAVVFEVTLKGSNSSEVLSFPNSGGKDNDFDLLIKQLATNKQVKILQRPRIQTSDGVAASLFVGKAGNVEDTGHHSINELLGLTLDVNPTITSDRKLQMNLAQTIERFGGTTNIQNVGAVPITTRHEFHTDVTLADRQTMVFAGSVDDTQDKPSKGVPVLKNTPLIGGLFRNHPHKVRVETLLALRATILPEQQAKNSKPLINAK
jgi:type II secretory pathway component GspD/PulD (secretin)